VNITLSTHDCEGLSQKDVDLATVIDKYAKSEKLVSSSHDGSSGNIIN